MTRSLLRRPRHDPDSDTRCLCRLYNLVVQCMQCRADHCPFYHIFVALAKGLPDSLFFIRLAGDCHSGATASDGLAIRSDAL